MFLSLLSLLLPSVAVVAIALIRFIGLLIAAIQLLLGEFGRAKAA